jgi:hypothetical protein
MLGLKFCGLGADCGYLVVLCRGMWPCRDNMDGQGIVCGFVLGPREQVNYEDEDCPVVVDSVAGSNWHHKPGIIHWFVFIRGMQKTPLTT